MEDWFEIPKIFVLAGGVWVLLSIWVIVMRWRRGFWKLGFKEVSQSMVFIGGFTWAMYFLVTSILLLLPLNNWLIAYMEGKEWLESTLWVLNSIPFFYVITILFIACWVLGRTFSYKPKYSEGEKVLLKEERLKWKKKLGWFGKLIKVK